MSLRSERRRKPPEVNIVPLIDVLTTLIFFFLVMMQFRMGHTLNITLPEINTAGKNTLPRTIDISVTKDGLYYYNGELVAAAEVTQILQRLSSASDKPPLVIRADEGTPLKNVTFLMDECRKSGFEDFRLQSRENQ
ncbi:MAG TPA: biopolymer transporter ExbD [Opitutales bacterium]|nr:biopolymer transporter ExbD [Opitutales bacterium]